MVATFVKLVGMGITVFELLIRDSPDPVVAGTGFLLIVLGQTIVNLKKTPQVKAPSEVERALESCTDGTATDWDKFDVQADYITGRRTRW